MINIILSLFNAALSFFISDGYGTINYVTLYFLWIAIFIFFLSVSIVQIRVRIRSVRKEGKLKNASNRLSKFTKLFKLRPKIRKTLANHISVFYFNRIYKRSTSRKAHCNSMVVIHFK